MMLKLCLILVGIGAIQISRDKFPQFPGNLRDFFPGELGIRQSAGVCSPLPLGGADDDALGGEEGVDGAGLAHIGVPQHPRRGLPGRREEGGGSASADLNSDRNNYWLDELVG